MIKEREPALERMSVLFQVGITLLCFLFTLWYSDVINTGSVSENKEPLVISILIIPIWFGLLELFELGSMARIQKYLNLIKQYAMVVSLGAISITLLAEVLGYEWLTPLMTLKFSVLTFVVLTSEKLASRMMLRYFRRKGYNTRQILIIADDSSSDFINQILETGDWGYKIWGIMTDSEKNKVGVRG